MTPTAGTGRPVSEQPSADDLAAMMSMITGHWVSQIVATVAHLGLADQLDAGPLTAAQLAAASATDPSATSRLLRACAAIGLLDQRDDAFASTPLLRTLHSGAEHSLADFARLATAQGPWLAWGRGLQAVREGREQATAALGKEIFDYFADNPDEGALFSTAMADLSAPVIAESVPVIDTTGVNLVVDVGGANGTFVHALMTAHPDIKGLVLDLPHVVPGALAEARRLGLADRFAVVAGDFFAAVPAADLYLLKYILHGWDDDACVRLLRRVREAMNRCARAVIVEIVQPHVDEPGAAPGALMDMNMLVMTSGRERDLTEFDDLFARSGLRRTSITPVQPPYCVIEVTAY